MRPKLFEIKYFETYYFANIIDNILRDKYTYIRLLNEFFGDNYKNFLEPFPKISRLHDFIRFIVHNFNHEDILNSDTTNIILNKEKLWVEVACEYYGLEFETFGEWLSNEKKDRQDITVDDIVEYINELILCGPYEELLEKMSEEIFFILFLNRVTLKIFNDSIAFYIHDLEIEELEEEELQYFAKKGVLKRVAIPVWVQRSVLYRDRGMCINCHKDISGLVNIGSIENFDHIVPLNLGGCNDVTNIQLLCETCNNSKGDRNTLTSFKYERWY